MGETVAKRELLVIMEAVRGRVREGRLEKVREGEGVEEGLTVLVALALTTTPPPLSVFKEEAIAKVLPVSPAPSITTPLLRLRT